METAQMLWFSLLQHWPYSERLLFTVGFLLVHEAVFIPLNIANAVVDHFGLLQKYRVQSEYPPKPLIMRTVRDLALTHLFVWTPLLYFVLYPAMVTFGGVHFSPTLPSLPTLLLHVFLCMAVEDTSFYWAHRALHHPSIYKYIHKQHHEYKATVGIASEYAHPVEGLLSNVLPTVLGAVLFQVHIVSFWVWLALRVWETIDAHCGYELPWSPWNMFSFQGGTARHDYHHSHNLGSYGSFFNIWDRVCGTDAAFKAYMEKKNQQKHKVK